MNFRAIGAYLRTQLTFDLAPSTTTGLFHATGPTSVSRFDFTKTLASVCDYDLDLITPIGTEELGQEAPRPTDSTLDSTRLYDTLDWTFRTPTDAFETIKQTA